MNIKKIVFSMLLLLGITSLSNYNMKHNIIINSGFTYLPVKSPGVIFSTSYFLEFEKSLTENLSVSLGPTFSLTASYHRALSDNNPENKATLATNVGFETDLNFKITENNVFYVGSEVGVGAGIYFNKNNIVNPDIIARLIIGSKLNEKYNLGAYFGIGKGIVGFQAGYIF